MVSNFLFMKYAFSRVHIHDHHISSYTDMELIYVLSFNDLHQLQQLPSTDAIVFFTCRHCKISQLANAAFIDVPNITSLDLSFNEISSESLNPDIFRGPQSEDEYTTIRLAILDLSDNSITFLDEKLFEHTPHIKKLDLSHNHLSGLDEGTGVALSGLAELEVNCCIYELLLKLTPSLLITDPRFGLHTYFRSAELNV
jgi:Leucine-rich repeat (LRR) protein